MAQPESDISPSNISTAVVEEFPEDCTTVASTDCSSLPGYLPWEDDLEMMSKYLDRKEELEESHQDYMANNPELKALLSDFVQALLIQKPEDVYQFAREFFNPFDPKAPHAAFYPSHRVPAQQEQQSAN